MSCERWGCAQSVRVPVGHSIVRRPHPTRSVRPPANPVEIGPASAGQSSLARSTLRRGLAVRPRWAMNGVHCGGRSRYCAAVIGGKKKWRELARDWPLSGLDFRRRGAGTSKVSSRGCAKTGRKMAHFTGPLRVRHFAPFCGARARKSARVVLRPKCESQCRLFGRSLHSSPRSA